MRGGGGKSWEKRHFLHMRLKNKKLSKWEVSSNSCLGPYQSNTDLSPHVTCMYSLMYYYFYRCQYICFILGT